MQCGGEWNTHAKKNAQRDTERERAKKKAAPANKWLVFIFQLCVKYLHKLANGPPSTSVAPLTNKQAAEQTSREKTTIICKRDEQKTEWINIELAELVMRSRVQHIGSRLTDNLLLLCGYYITIVIYEIILFCWMMRNGGRCWEEEKEAII